MHRVGYVVLNMVNVEIMFFPYLELTPKGREVAKERAFRWAIMHNHNRGRHVYMNAVEY